MEKVLIFEPYSLHGLELKNDMVMAPMMPFSFSRSSSNYYLIALGIIFAIALISTITLFLVIAPIISFVIAVILVVPCVYLYICI